MTLTTPCRFTTLHFSHRTFADAFTFMVKSFDSLESVYYPTTIEVVWGKFNQHLVPGQDPDVVHPYLAGDVGQHNVSVRQLNAKHRIR
jgi:hypothetical protein